MAMAVFVAVVDEGSFAAAARTMAISRSTAVRAVTDLEALLGARLLDRMAASVQATEAGRRYAEDCRRIVRGVEAAELAASQCTRPDRPLTLR